MWQESSETSTELRSGLTTGSCATACCVAACRALFAKDYPNAVDINLPRGQVVTLTLTDYRTLTDAGSADKIQGVRVATIKDAGDDPDATHGATVFVELRLVQQPGVVFKAAQGVGTVTKTGLLLDVGEPAINPVPRKMIQEHLQRYALMHDYQKSKQQNIKGSPTYVIDGGRQVLYGNVGYRVLHANIEELLKNPRDEKSWC